LAQADPVDAADAVCRDDLSVEVGNEQVMRPSFQSITADVQTTFETYGFGWHAMAGGAEHLPKCPTCGASTVHAGEG